MTATGKRKYPAYAAILVAVLAAFGNSLQNELVSDDLSQIAGNPDIRSLSNLPVIFTTGIWHTDTFAGAMYRPVAFLSWMLEYSLAGAAPFLYHLDNVILHFLCTVMVFAVVGLLVKDGKTPLYAALVFAVHPVHTEVVAWVACRMELLYTLFGLTSFWLFVKRDEKRGYLLLSCLSYAAALLSKEAAASVPLFIFLYLYFFVHKGTAGSRVLRSVTPLYPYIAVTLAYAALRAHVIGFGHLTSDILENYEGFSRYDMFLVMCRAFYEYIRLSFLPFNLNAEYLFRAEPSFLSVRVLLPILVFAASVAAAVKKDAGDGFKLVTFSSLWFFSGLLPVSNIIASGNIMVERALYLPSLASCLLIGLAVSRVQESGRIPRARELAGVSLALVLVVYSSMSIKRNAFWATQKRINEEAVKMYRHRIEVFPDNVKPYIQLAGLSSELGDYGPEPEAALVRAKSLDPSMPETYYMLAGIYMRRSEPDRALDEVAGAIRLKPAPEYYYLAGQALEKLGRYGEAVSMLDRALEMTPGNDAYHAFKGRLLMEAGDDDSALSSYEKAGRLNPGNYDSFLMQGIILDSKRQFGPAIENIRKAVSLRPDIPDLHYFLAVAYLDAGDPGQAKEELEKAVALRPDYREAVELLGDMPDGQGRTVTPQAPPG